MPTPAPAEKLTSNTHTMIRKQDYPPEWAQLSLAARERAGQKCEWCGAPNGLWILRDRKPAQYQTVWVNNATKEVPFLDFSIPEPQTFAAKYYRDAGMVKIILTVAHLDRDRWNNDPANLAALCQRCHLNHDRHAQHIPHRKYGRYHDREQQGKLKL